MFFRKVIHNYKIKKIIKQGLKLGNGCSIGKNVNFGTEPYLIEIGNNVRISNNTNFITHDGGIWTLRKMNMLDNADYFGKIKVGNNVNIGMNVAILPGVTIGENSIIGYGSIVTKNVPSNTVFAGVPAKYIETIDEYYEKKKNLVDYTKNLNKKEKRLYLENKYKGKGYE